MAKKTKLTKEDKKFTQGFCLAIAELSRYGAHEPYLLDALSAAGYTLEEIERSDVAEYDLQEIRQLLEGEAE